MFVVSRTANLFNKPFYDRKSESTAFTKVAALGIGILLLTGSAIGARDARKPEEIFPAKYLGGREIPQIASGSKVSWAPEQGPQYSALMACYAQSKILDTAMPAWSQCNEVILPQCEPSDYWQGYHNLLQEKKPEFINGYIRAVDDLKPSKVTPANAFPHNLEAYRFNGLFLTGNGNRACNLNDLENFEECQPMTDAVAASLKILGHEKLAYTDSSFRRQGFQFGIPDEYGNLKHEITIGINPKITENYRAALNLITDKILNNSCFFEKDPQDIIAFLMEVHRTLADSIPCETPACDSTLRPGQYRLEEMTVFHDPKMEHNLEEMINHLNSMKVSQQGIKYFINSWKKIKAEYPVKRHLSEFLSSKEIEVWKKLAFLPPSPHKISELMLQFATDLKRLVKKDIHPIAMAAWVHCELGRIHPFSDSNGRLGRIMMNTFLVRGGYEPVIIPNDTSYTIAVNADGETPGAFAEYLAGLIKEQRVKPYPLIFDT